MYKKAVKVGRVLGCHQKSSRSFSINNYQFPVCSRCFGLYLFNIIALISILFNYEISLLISIILCIPMLFDGILQAVSNYKSNNIKRIITGSLAGIGSVYILYNIIYLIF